MSHSGAINAARLWSDWIDHSSFYMPNDVMPTDTVTTFHPRTGMWGGDGFSVVGPASAVDWSDVSRYKTSKESTFVAPSTDPTGPFARSDILPAILRPGMYAGEQGVRSLEAWLADAVVEYLNTTQIMRKQDA